MRGRSWLISALVLGSMVACSGGDGSDDPKGLEGAPAGGASAEGGTNARGEDAITGGSPGSTPVADAGAAETPDAAPPPPDAAPPEPDAHPVPTCSGEAFTALNERMSYDDEFGLRYQGLSGETNPLDAILLDIKDPARRLMPGFYDLAGTNLDDCEICLAGLKGCDPATGRCGKVFYPRAGVVEITSYGDVGEQFTATLHGIEFEEVEVDPNTAHSTPVADGEIWCNQGQTIDVEVLPTPVEVGETVRNFSLQNCDTEEFVDIYSLGAEAKGLWLIAAAGWCSACAQFLPAAFDAMAQIDGDLGAGALVPMIIVGEDSNYNQPTTEFCRRYARHYGADPGIFYVDHDGRASFATTFQYIWPYISDAGEFSLPWNALIKGGTFEYFYGDRSGISDLNTKLNEILR
jgi:hypothetical protein